MEKTTDKAVLNRVRALCRLITYKPDYVLSVSELSDGGGVLMQWSALVTHADDGHKIVATGRKWYVSPYAADSEILQTALMGALAMEEHECREFFKVDGQKVFNPHFDVLERVEQMKAGTVHLQTRDPKPDPKPETKLPYNGY